MEKPVRAQWTQLDFYTAWDNYLSELGRNCVICGLPVDGIYDQNPLVSGPKYCDVEGCPQSTGPTTTTDCL